jgi:penicillin-binding protein 2
MERNPALHNNLETWRILTFGAFLSLVFIIYITRLFSMQILGSEDYALAAEDNRTETLNLAAPRGIIVDRNNTILARNIASYNVVITPASLPDDDGDIQRVYRQLSALIDVPVNLNAITPENPFVPCTSPHGINQIATFGETTAPYSPVRIKCNIDATLARIIQENAIDLPGVGIEIEPVRDYPTGALTANLIGYLGPIPAELAEEYKALGLVANRDKVGYAGVELTQQDLLSGVNGTRVVEVDVAGQVLRDLQPPVDSVPGYNLRLTIDTRLQKVAELVLVQEIDALNRISPTGIRATSGVVIVINPQTGEILAMVSYPGYENNRFARIIPGYYLEQLNTDGREPLLNHAIQAERPSGSVFKLVTATGALNEGVVSAEQIVDAPGQITLTEKYYANDPGRAKDFVDWNEEVGGFGQIDFVNGIANSSNVYFYKLGGGYQDEIPEGLGVCRLGTYARALGYGEPSGIELPGEEDGLIPDPTWKRITKGENWSTGDTYLASVGQGYILATPLQVLLSATTIANDGRLMQPTLIREVFDGEGNLIRPFQPVLKWDITRDNRIEIFETQGSVSNSCRPTGQFTNVDPYVVEKVQQGMREAVLSGTLRDEFQQVEIAAAGKTGTAEYCDNIAQSKNLCEPGNWPTHGWTVAYAPYENPEIAVVAFVYNGGEGAKIAGPIVRQVIEYYFRLKAIDTAEGAP